MYLCAELSASFEEGTLTVGKDTLGWDVFDLSPRGSVVGGRTLRHERQPRDSQCCRRTTPYEMVCRDGRGGVHCSTKRSWIDKWKVRCHSIWWHHRDEIIGKVTL